MLLLGPPDDANLVEMRTLDLTEKQDCAVKWSPELLREFEDRIAEAYNKAEIRAPIHLSYGSETELIKIFQGIAQEDFVLSTWRSHYHALLHGVPENKVEKSVRSGHSISLSFPEHRFYSSAIVGGMLSIGVGLAEGLKRQGSSAKVWVFIGDMAANTGLAFSSVRLARVRDLNFRLIIEDNEVSVCTPTKAVWGEASHDLDSVGVGIVSRYSYKSIYPHAGAGKRIEF